MNNDELVQVFTAAIHAGDNETAQSIVAQLANMHLKLNIDILPQNDSAVENPFKITVQVEDREAAGASFDLLVQSTDRIKDLKRRVRLKFGFPEEVQRWIIGKIIQDDESTLTKCKVRSPTTVFLYLIPAHSVGLMHKPRNEGFENDNIGFVNMDRSTQNTSTNPSWQCSSCTFKNDPLVLACVLCTKERDNDTEWAEAIRGPIAEESGVFKIGDRVVSYINTKAEKGTVRWIGTLPDVECGQLTVGVEFDNKVGVGTGTYKDMRLFFAKQDHASLEPVCGLIKE